MLGFKVEIRAGASVYQQVVYAAKRAIVSGRLRPGERFASVRILSQELKINPNTAHKVIAALVDQGLLEVRPGIGTMVAESPPASRRERSELLGSELERLVVEAKKLALELDDVVPALGEHWHRLSRQSAAEEKP
jgi:GntR family transcriptional regulator